MADTSYYAKKKQESDKKIEEALNARKARNAEEAKQASLAEKKKASDSKVNAALAAREKRIQSSLPTILNDMQSELDAYMSDYNQAGSPYGTYEQIRDPYREKTIGIKKLRNRVEAYRSYIGDDVADGVLSTLDQLYNGYNGRLEMSQYATEEDYNKDVAKSKKYYEDWGHYSDLPYFMETATYRNYGNPTAEDLAYYDAATDYTSFKHERDASGNLTHKDIYGNDLILVPMTDEEDGLFGSGGGMRYASPVERDGKYKVQDPVGMYLAADVDERESALGDSSTGTRAEIFAKGTKDHWEQMTEDDLNTYYFLRGTYGLDKAMEFVDATTEKRNARWGALEAQRLQNIDNGLTKFVSHGLFSLEAGLDQWGSGVKQALTREEVPTSGTQFANQEILNDLDGFAKIAYQAGNVTGNMLPSIIISNGMGELAGAASVGMSAGGNAYGQALKEGYSVEQARTYGVLIGAAEASLQYLIGGIGDLGGISSKALLAKASMIDTAFLRLVTKYSINIGSEMLEEEIQLFLEPAIKSIVFGEVYEIPKAEAILETALVTFLSTGALDGGGTIATDMAESKQLIDTGRTIMGSETGVPALLDLASEMSGASAEDIQKSLTKQANKVSERMDAGNKSNNTARKVAKLYDTVQTAKTSQNQADIVKSLTRERNGFSEKSATAIAEAMVARANGQELSLKQERLLNAYKDDVRVQNAEKTIIKNDKSTMGQRNQKVAQLGQNIAFEAAVKEFTKQQYTEKEFTPEGKFEVATDGKAIDKDGNLIDIKGVASISSEGMLLDLGDGKTIDAKDVSYADKNAALIYEAVAKLGDKINAETANKLIKQYGGKNAQVFSRGIAQAYTYGFHGISKSELNGKLASDLSSAQINAAYELGKKYRPVKDMADKANAKVKKAPGEKGVYYRDKAGNATDIRTWLKENESGLKDIQKTGIEMMEKMSEMLGIRFNVFESWVENGVTYYLDENGKKQVGDPNGFYDRNTGEIYIDLHAGTEKRNGQIIHPGTIIFTVAHEMTHFMRQFSPAEFTKIAKIVFQHGGMKGSITELVALKQAKAKAKGKYLSYDAALEEVVADGMETILKDGKVVEFMADVKKQDQRLWAKLKEWFQNLAEFLKEMVTAYSSYSAQSTEGARVAEFSQKLLNQIEQIWAKGALEAGKNYQDAVEGFEETAEALSEVGIGSDENTNSVFALRDSLAFKDILAVGRKNFDTESIAQLVANQTGRSIEDARKWLDSELTIANLVAANPEFLDFEPDDRYEAIKKNSDYPQGTVDLSNLCPKREEFTAMFDMLQKKYPNKLFTAQDVADMRKILSDANITVACGACFVEDRRQLIGEIADTFINMWNEAVTTGKPLQKTNAAGSKVDLLVTKALAKQYGLTAGTKIMATDTYIPTQYDLTTYEGFKKLEKEHPIIAMSFNRYNNSRGQQSARLIEGRAEYKRQVLGWSPSKVRTVNNNGGLRIFSFSDFEVVHLLDLVQVVIDCAAKGVKIQGYTKIPAFAKLVRNTGIKLNRSLIPKGNLGYHMENGKVVLDYDSTEGIDINDKNFIDESDNPNVGNILIGINPTQIGAAMLDPFVDYIIPFHSNKAKAILVKLGTGEWVNYKESQHEKDISTGTSSKHNVNIYTQVINKYHPTNKVEFVDAFLQECKKQGKIPRYAEFLNKEYKADGTYQDEYGAFDYTYREGYHKLLVDFKMFDKEGNILPQGNITPNLDESFMTELLNAEVDRKQSYEFPQEVYDAIEKQFGKKTVDNASNLDKNSVIDTTSRGDNVDNRGVRKGTTETERQESAGHYRGRNSRHVSNAQEAQSWGDLDTAVQGRVRKLVKTHIDESTNSHEIFLLLCNLVGKTDATMTMPYYEKAVGILTEKLFNNAMSSQYDQFKDNWKILSGDIKGLYRNIKGSIEPSADNSNSSIAEISESEYQQLVDYFGTTSDFAVAGYLLKTGQMLDFSGQRHGYASSKSRKMDHRDVWDVWEHKGRSENDELVNMIGNGNIRLVPEIGGINLAIMPNKSQISVLRDYINHFHGEVTVDVDYVVGGTIHSFSYKQGTSSSKVIADIKAYFENGTIPEQQSGLLFSDRDTESVSNRSLLANAFEGIITDPTELKKIKEYKEQVALLDEQEQKLRELNAQIKELSFGKGPRDKAKISALRDEAVKTANRIAIYDKRIFGLEAATPLQNILKRERDIVRKRERQKGKEALAEQKAEFDAKQRETIERWKENRKTAVAKARETAEKRDARTKLQKLVLDTVKWISYPAKTDVKCPDILKKPYADFLNGIDLSSKRLADGGDATKNDLRLANAMDSLATALDKIMLSQDPSQDVDNVLDTGYLDLPADFVQKLRDMTEGIKAMMVEGEYVVNTMTAAEVRKLSQMIRTLNHAIKTMSKLYANLRFANIEALGLDTMEFIDALGEIEKTGGMKDFVQWDNSLPYYAFKRFGKGGESVFEGLMDAQDKLAFLAQEIFNFRDKAWTDKEAKAWSEDTHTIKLPNGTELTLTTADAMSIYCLSRREQGLQHLLGGGTRIMGIQKGSQKAKDSRSLLTIKDIDEIISSLTDRQKKVAEDIQEFMSTVCSDWGNEVSMKRFLTKEFNEKFYFPIESNDENLPTKDPAAQQSDLFRLLNISATKPITPGANNEVIIRNIFDVFTGHASDMARLNAYGMPLLDYMKWLNYREKTANEEGQITVRGVRKSMEKAFGNAANSYVLNLVKDVNGRPSDGGDPTILMKWMRNAKTASVGSSLRVATLQITSYPRAALVLSPKSLALGLTKIPNIKRAKKYCGIALWKSFGFYDTNISRSIEDQMRGVKDVKQKLIELSLKGAEWGDAITWGALWNACEYEVAKTTKNKVGSEEFYQEVGKKLREVVYRTQVVDSTLTRSQLMRSKRGMAQEAAAFMSEPTLSANILMDAGLQFSMEKRRTGSAKIAWKNTGKYIGRAVAVYAIGQLAAALLEGLWDAWRDDEDEEFKKKYLDAFIENLALDLVPFNKIPIVSDVFEAALTMFDVGFYSSDKMSTTWLTQAVSAVDAWKSALSGESSTTVYNALYKTTRAISSFYGVSFSGVMRKGVALWNNTAGSYDSTLKIRQYELSKGDLGNELYEAIVSGNTRQADSLKAQFEDQDSMHSAVRKALRENDPRIKAAAQAQLNGDPSERVRIAREIIADGFVQDDVVAAINAEINAMTPDAGGSDPKKKGFYTAEDFAKEIANRDQAAAYAAKADVIETAQKNGKSAEDAEKSFNSSAKSALKEQFLVGNLSEQETINALTTFCGFNEQDALSDVQYWAFKKEYPEVFADDQWFDTYYDKIADSGISIDVYMGYRETVSTITGDGKKERRMAVINSLPITRAQKDALYFAEGWAESKLYEAPWH